MYKRMAAIMLAVVMIVSMLPATVYASGQLNEYVHTSVDDFDYIERLFTDCEGALICGFVFDCENEIVFQFLFLSDYDTHWINNLGIYGDNPVKWNERQADPRDPLGLNTYTLVPDINAIRQSGNLYAFCANNPVTFVDPSGERLAFPGEIHRQVSKHIVQNNPDLVREKWVIYPGINNPLGRVDLVDINNGWIFEIKPWYWPRWEAENQLAQYTWGSFLNKQLKTLGREPKPYPGTGDDYKFNDYFYYNRYWVGYWYDGNGIISYTYVEDPNKVIQEMAIAGGIAFAIFMYIITQGAYSPGIPGLTY